jgi:hypothetical protein
MSGPALWYAIGGAIAIVVIILGAAIGRPAGDKLGALGRTIASQGSPPTAAQNAERETLLNRLTSVAQLNAVLLIVVVVLMAIGRYV